MKWLCALTVALGFAVANDASAETWRVEFQPLPGADPTCPVPALFFEFTLNGSEFAVLRPNGDRERATVDSAGTVKAQFSTLAGTTTITGNARTRALQLTARGLSGCAYALNPIEASRTLTQWKTTINAVTVNNMCSQGTRGTVIDSGRALSVIWDKTHLFGAPLNADGSADLWTRIGSGSNARAKVTVVPGTGPREVNWVTYTNACRYRIVPD